MVENLKEYYNDPEKAWGEKALLQDQVRKKVIEKRHIKNLQEITADLNAVEDEFTDKMKENLETSENDPLGAFSRHLDLRTERAKRNEALEKKSME